MKFTIVFIAIIISSESWARPVTARRSKVVKAAKSMLGPEFGRREVRNLQKIKLAEIRAASME